MPFDKELEVARRVALRSGKVALEHMAAGVIAQTKADASPVTIADQECERLIAAALSEAFPEDGLLGEEGAERESRSGRRWIIDPIDGTRDFLRGSHVWSVLIALEQDNEVVAGVCYLPVLNSLFSAAKGGGAFRDSTPIRVSSVSTPSQAVLCLNGLNDAMHKFQGMALLEWTARFSAVRSMGGCLDAMLIAQGQADAWIEPTAAPWDLAALKIIIEEAGGRFFNFDGGATIHGGNCMACAPGLEEDLRRFAGALPR